MASIVIMPKQGLMMTEGTITSWLKKEGEDVVTGQPLFEMETDKLTITMNAEVSGTLLKIIHPEGDVVPITQPIAIVGAPGEDISALLAVKLPPPPPLRPLRSLLPSLLLPPAAAPEELPASASLVIMPKQGLMMTEVPSSSGWFKRASRSPLASPCSRWKTDKLTITMDAEVSGTHAEDHSSRGAMWCPLPSLSLSWARPVRMCPALRAALLPQSRLPLLRPQPLPKLHLLQLPPLFPPVTPTPEFGLPPRPDCMRRKTAWTLLMFPRPALTTIALTGM